MCPEETETISGDGIVPEKGFCSPGKRQEVEGTEVSTHARWEPQAGTRRQGALLRKRPGVPAIKDYALSEPGDLGEMPQCT